MKEFFLKIFGYIVVVSIIGPIIGLFVFLSVCKNYFYSLVISSFTFYLILGFNGVSCFLAICVSVVLNHIGSYLHKKGLKFIDDSMKKKMDEMSETERTQTNRGFKIDNILGRMGGL